MSTIKATILRALNPGYSYCEKCKMPWNHVKSKSVRWSETNATFATCQECWDNSTLEELKEYYTDVYCKQRTSLIECNMKRGENYKMEHTLEHLLKCVEKEYFKTPDRLMPYD
jgi:hypothetical protein